MLLFVTKIKITQYCTYSSRSDQLWYARPTIEIIAASGRGNKRCYRYDYLDCSVGTYGIEVGSVALRLELPSVVLYEGTSDLDTF